MGQFIQKNEYLILGFLLLLVIVVRIPITPHEIGVDSFLIHQLADSISTYGTLSWALNPLSLMGVYPLSYPSGSPVLLSIVSQITGLDTETVILVTCYILAILGTLSAYIMVKRITKNLDIAFLTAFFFALSPVFIELTTWTATTRNLYIAIFPLFLWAFFYYNQTGSRINKQLVIGIILLLTLFVSHRVFFLLVILLGAYIVTKTYCIFRDRSGFTGKTIDFIRRHQVIIFPAIFLTLFLIQFSGLKIFGNITSFYQSGSLVSGNSLPIYLINFFVNYCSQLGLFFPVCVVGIAVLLLKNNKDFNEILILLTILFLSPVLFVKFYTPIFLLPFISFLTAVGMVTILIKLKTWETRFRIKQMITIKNIKVPIIVFLLISALVFSLFTTQRHLFTPADTYGSDGWLTDQDVAIGNFFKASGESAYSSNVVIKNSRIFAATGVLPPDGGFLYAYYFANGQVNMTRLGIVTISLDQVNIETRSLFKIKESPQVPKPQEPSTIPVLINNNQMNRYESYSSIYTNGEYSIVTK